MILNITFYYCLSSADNWPCRKFIFRICFFSQIFFCRNILLIFKYKHSSSCTDSFLPTPNYYNDLLSYVLFYRYFVLFCIIGPLPLLEFTRKLIDEVKPTVEKDMIISGNILEDLLNNDIIVHRHKMELDRVQLLSKKNLLLIEGISLLCSTDLINVIL